MIDPQIDRDVACVQCGYNLRGLPVTGLCPECGHGIAESLAAPDLASQGRRWLSRVRAGLWMHIYNLGLGVLYVLPYLGLYLGLRQYTPIYRLLLRGPVHVLIVIPFSVVALAGTWLMTMPNPGGQFTVWQSKQVVETSGGLTIAQLLRCFACFNFLGQVASLLGSPRLGTSPISAYWLWWAIDFVTIYLFYLFIEKRLAVMVQMRGIARQAEILKWVKPSVDAALPILILIVYLASWIRPPQHLQLLAVREVLHIAVNLWAIRVLFGLLQPFRRALQAARV